MLLSIASTKPVNYWRHRLFSRTNRLALPSPSSSSSKTKPEMSHDLIRQLQANHEVLVSKIAHIESTLKDKNLNVTNNNQNDGGNVDNRNDIETEQQKLIAENQSLRNEIQRITQRLTDLEIQIKGSPNSSSTQVQQSQSEAKKVAVESKQKTEKQKKTETKQAKSDTKPKGGKGNKAATTTELESERLIDVSRLDLRVGKIIDVKKHPDADTLYVEQIECGEDKPRTVVSGLVKFVPVEEMQNRMVVVLCNLKPAKMRGIVSEAMVMCASTPEKVEVLLPPEGSIPGDRVTFAKYPGQPDQLLNPKKKIWEQIAPDLTTNDNLEATYKGDTFIVPEKGPVKSITLKNVPVK
ncbi:Aminoacyl tRNA synthase complex-interacting multifunctional protein 1, variant 3 [Dermatophagoides farinae]|uniref:Aminoacyl tRNA synthase complex-interacting multifunctional protein 1, variant 3 n=1 Tax=Dermatophagoides farinae TaxID=6954 RepID=A0A922KYT3_DERFA|nr:Aminoacyl tRNA synthase complex-interacting multifunctional protein 1, variant 3 [Dermatophagoides farinae]